MAPIQVAQLFVTNTRELEFVPLLVWTGFYLFLLAPFFSFLIGGYLTLRKLRRKVGGGKEVLFVTLQLGALLWFVLPQDRFRDEEMIGLLFVAGIGLCSLSLAIAVAWIANARIEYTGSSAT